ncbi:uncharacterized protein LOC111592433 [Drosophila hydei]|uniref:Uncharacterized protein LOC111592433 n=1 Tax=Drosophila hydei TaxID=7224 RepID=A0A6J1L864_DROHY|nr:uncharacterized protein LOC111592433 [Drosophila hydei]
MHMWCERISATLGGILVGLWYGKTFPAEQKKADDSQKSKKK